MRTPVVVVVAALAVAALAVAAGAVAAVVVASMSDGPDPSRPATRGAPGAAGSTGAVPTATRGAPGATGRADAGGADPGGSQRPDVDRGDGSLRFESPPLGRGPLTLRRVSFRVAGGRAGGLLAVPPGRRPRMPAVLYLHGLGADSSDFATEMIFMAAKGTVALAIDSADVGAPALPGDGLAGLREDLRRRGETKRRILRAVALLEARHDVDRTRIAFVGFSRGAAVGALAVGELPDLAAEVYISGAAGTATWPGRLGPLDRGEQAVARRLAARIDPAHALTRLHARRPRLVQYGTRDEIVPQAALRTFATAVPAPKRLTVRARAHALDVMELYERLEWLDHRLAVTGPPVRGAPVLLRRR